MTGPIPAPHSLGHHPAMQPFPEWQVHSVHHIHNGVEALLVSHKEHKTQACWWAASNGDESQLLAQNILELGAPWRDDLLAYISPYLQHITDAALSALEPSSEAISDDHAAHALLAALPAHLRLQILSFWFQNTQANTLILPPQALLNVEEQQEDAAFAPAYVRLLLQTRLTNGHILAISPFSGQPVFSQLTLHCAEGTACRFVDEGEQLVFYLFWPKTQQSTEPHIGDEPLAASHAPTPIFYYPSGSFLLGEAPLTPLIPIFLLSWVMTHPDFAQQLHPAPRLHMEGHSVGHTSNLWDSFSNTDTHQQEATGQNAPSFPFLSDIWNNNPPRN